MGALSEGKAVENAAGHSPFTDLIGNPDVALRNGAGSSLIYIFLSLFACEYIRRSNLCARNIAPLIHLSRFMKSSRIWHVNLYTTLVGIETPMIPASSSVIYASDIGCFHSIHRNLDCVTSSYLTQLKNSVAQIGTIPNAPNPRARGRTTGRSRAWAWPATSKSRATAIVLIGLVWSLQLGGVVTSRAVTDAEAPPLRLPVERHVAQSKALGGPSLSQCPV